MRKIKIGDRFIGNGEPIYIIGEAGVNHNGNLDLAFELVDIAKDAGCDAVKFQTFIAEDVVSKYAPKAPYQKALNGSQLDMAKRLELKFEDFKKLKIYSDKKGITFLSTPFDPRSVDFLDELGVPLFKVGSGELTNLPFLKYIAEKRRPVILSTGMSTLGEIEEALETIQSAKNENVALLHCTSNYPSSLKSCNLLAIKTLKEVFDTPVGYSDHTLSLSVPSASVALGACIIEKHFTKDRNLPGPDHRASVDPYQLKQMVCMVRETEEALGCALKRPQDEELEVAKVTRRSIVAAVCIKKGTEIKREMVTLKRPGYGMPPKFLKFVLGRTAKRDIAKDEIIKLEDLK